MNSFSNRQILAVAVAALSTYSFGAGSAERPAQGPTAPPAGVKQDVPAPETERNIGVALATLFKVVPEFASTIQEKADKEIIKIGYVHVLSTNLLSPGQRGVLTNIGVAHSAKGRHELIFSDDAARSPGRALVFGALMLTAAARADDGRVLKESAKEWKAIVDETIPRVRKNIAIQGQNSGRMRELGISVSDVEATLKELSALEFGVKVPR